MQIRAVSVEGVSCWFAGASDWMKTSLQSYILYKEQRAIPNEPLGIPWPLLNIWNIYAALNFFFFFLKHLSLDIWSVEWILFARIIQLSIVNTL